MAQGLEPLRPKSVFLCYRRDDSEEVVDRVYETLAGQLSNQALFRDIDDIEAGADFAAVIQERLSGCHVVLIFIGRDWATAQANGRRRLDDPNDHVRLEVQAALALPYAQVIPVLVKRAQMPSADALPAELARLPKLNAFTVRSAGKDYRQDTAALVEEVRKATIESSRRRAVAAAAERAATQRREWDEQVTSAVKGSAAGPGLAALLDCIAAQQAVVICGSGLGTDPERGDPASREAGIAADVAAVLGLPAPGLDETRPLAQLAFRCQEDGRRVPFIRALRAAADRLAPASGLRVLLTVPLRLLLTPALDFGLEAAFSELGVTAESVCYTPANPFELDNVDLAGIERDLRRALVFHVAGSARGGWGDTAVSDVEWRRFSDALREREHRPRKLAELFGSGRTPVILGGGYPTGFVEFWLDLAIRLGSREFFVGVSALSGDPSLARYLRETAGREDVRLHGLDDADRFSNKLSFRWAARMDSATSAGSARRGAAVVDTPPTDTAPDAAAGKRIDRGELKWPGARPFEEAESRYLWGRDEEVGLLVQGIRSSPVSLLFSASGMGRTSLLRAGLLPALRLLDLVPVVFRIDWTARAEPFRAQIVQTVIAEATCVSMALPRPEPDLPIWAFFHRREVTGLSSREGWSKFVLLFDQFEEFFTLGAQTPEAAAHARSAWAELSDLVEGRVPSEIGSRFDRDADTASSFDLEAPAPRVLLSLREDFLPMVESLRQEMPSLNMGGVRLRGLSRRAALAALLATAPPLFTQEGAEALVESLSRGSVGAGGTVGRPSDFAEVNPAMLQLLCYAMDQRRRELGLEQVDKRIVEESGGAAFASFYDAAFADLHPAAKEWVEDELVIDSGLRVAVSTGRAEADLARRGVPVAALETLVQRRVLAISASQDMRHVALANDLLLPAACASRDARLRRKGAGRSFLGVLDKLAEQMRSRGG